MKKTLTTKNMVRIAIMGAIAAVLMFFRFPLPFAPPFMDVDISEVPGLIGGFSMGHIPGVLIVLIKLIVKMITQGTQTGGIGELSNFIVSSTFILTAVLFYNRKRTLKNAIISLILGVIAMTTVATISNYFVIFPLYGININEFAAEFSQTNSLVNSAGTFLLFSIIPFNIIKGALNALIVMMLYKSISPLLKK